MPQQSGCDRRGHTVPHTGTSEGAHLGASSQHSVLRGDTRTENLSTQPRATSPKGKFFTTERHQAFSLSQRLCEGAVNPEVLVQSLGC